MKIAIQGHPTRGKEIIQILESLGGKNTALLKGIGDYYYYLNNKSEIRCHDYKYVNNYCNKYTLEEFEKIFPFKVGNKVIISGLPDYPKVITKMIWEDNEILYTFGDNTWFNTEALRKLEMKEERNITLTLDKAKEWYKKGGDLKQVALQAFTEKELNSLPKSWEEYTSKIVLQKVSIDKMPISSLPKKYIALYKLERLRDCYNNSCNDTNRIAIINNNGNIELYVNPPFNCFLTFKNHLLAREFFSNFKELIEIAKKLI